MLKYLLLAVLGCELVILSKPLYSQSLPETILTQVAPTLANLEQATYDQVNAYRSSQGLPPLRLDERISQQARIHSQQMAEGKVPFSHDGFEQRVEVISTVIPYRSAAENVAYNQGYSDPVTVAVEGWINSPGHQKNMVGDFNLTGIGMAQNASGEYYFTQIFILER
jgi:uncharacterized protein YkwD